MGSLTPLFNARADLFGNKLAIRSADHMPVLHLGIEVGVKGPVPPVQLGASNRLGKEQGPFWRIRIPIFFGEFPQYVQHLNKGPPCPRRRHGFNMHTSKLTCNRFPLNGPRDVGKVVFLNEPIVFVHIFRNYLRNLALVEILDPLLGKAL